MSTSRVAIRHREEWEARCETCLSWWPIDVEFWQPKSGMVRCKACWREYFRLKERGRTAVEAVAEQKRAAGRAHYAEHRQDRLARNRAWRAANPDRVKEYNRRYRAQHREKYAAQARAYYTECRDAILIKKRAKYREEAA